MQSTGAAHGESKAAVSTTAAHPAEPRPGNGAPRGEVQAMVGIEAGWFVAECLRRAEVWSCRAPKPSTACKPVADRPRVDRPDPRRGSLLASTHPAGGAARGISLENRVENDLHSYCRS
jgi:hypothetical protein